MEREKDNAEWPEGGSRGRKRRAWKLMRRAARRKGEWRDTRPKERGMWRGARERERWYVKGCEGWRGRCLQGAWRE